MLFPVMTQRVSCCPIDVLSVYGQYDVFGHFCGPYGHYCVYGGQFYHVAYGQQDMLPTFDCTGHSPCNLDGHCVDYVLMGSIVLTAQ